LIFYFTSITLIPKDKQAATNRNEENLSPAHTQLEKITHALIHAAAMTASRKEIKVGILGATGMSPLFASLL
jgi:hypothetical protein